MPAGFALVRRSPSRHGEIEAEAFEDAAREACRSGHVGSSAEACLYSVLGLRVLTDPREQLAEVEARARLARAALHQLARAARPLPPDHPCRSRGRSRRPAASMLARVHRQRALGDQARARARAELQRVGVVELRRLRARAGSRPGAQLRERAVHEARADPERIALAVGRVQDVVGGAAVEAVRVERARRLQLRPSPRPAGRPRAARGPRCSVGTGARSSSETSARRTPMEVLSSPGR